MVIHPTGEKSFSKPVFMTFKLCKHGQRLLQAIQPLSIKRGIIIYMFQYVEEILVQKKICNTSVRNRILTAMPLTQLGHGDCTTTSLWSLVLVAKSWIQTSLVKLSEILKLWICLTLLFCGQFASIFSK